MFKEIFKCLCSRWWWSKMKALQNICQGYIVVTSLIFREYITRSTVDTWNHGLYQIFCMLCIFPYTYMTFQLKKALYGFSLAYQNCQHHYSYILESLFKLKKKKKDSLNTNTVIPPQPKWLTGSSAYSMGMLEKGMIHILGGTVCDGGWFVVLLIMVYNLKLKLKLFISANFYLIFLDKIWQRVTETMDSETKVKWRLSTCKRRRSSTLRHSPFFSAP